MLPSSNRSSRCSGDVDIWQCVADLVNESLRVDIAGVKFYESADEHKPDGKRQ